MQLADIGMVAGDTSRSRAYLQALARNEILPSHVIILENSSDNLLPGQLDQSQSNYNNENNIETDECWSELHFNSNKSIKELLDELGVSYEITISNNINDPGVVDIIRCRSESVFIYSGFGGTLLKKEVLSAGKNFLHVHGGYLPDYKGSTTNYYSLINESYLGASSIFLSEEIDSGPVLLRKKFPLPKNRQAIDHIYDSGARAKVLVDTIQKYLNCGDWGFELTANTGGETYYIIHPVLKHIAILGDG